MSDFDFQVVTLALINIQSELSKNEKQIRNLNEILIPVTDFQNGAHTCLGSFFCILRRRMTHDE